MAISAVRRGDSSHSPESRPRATALRGKSESGFRTVFSTFRFLSPGPPAVSSGIQPQGSVCGVVRGVLYSYTRPGFDALHHPSLVGVIAFESDPCGRGYGQYDGFDDIICDSSWVFETRG